MKIRWLKPIAGAGPARKVGTIEENAEDLCRIWVEKGHAEYVEEDAVTDAQKAAEDYDRRSRGIEGPKESEGPQRHKAVESPKKIARR